MADTAPFSLPLYDKWAKSQIVYGDGIELEVDWDDVNQYEVAATLEKMLIVLKDHWNDEAYKKLGPDTHLSYVARDKQVDVIMKRIAQRTRE